MPAWRYFSQLGSIPVPQKKKPFHQSRQHCLYVKQWGKSSYIWSQPAWQYCSQRGSIPVPQKKMKPFLQNGLLLLHVKQWGKSSYTRSPPAWQYFSQLGSIPSIRMDCFFSTLNSEAKVAILDHHLSTILLTVRLNSGSQKRNHQKKLLLYVKQWDKSSYTHDSRRDGSSLTWHQLCNNQTELSVHHFGGYLNKQTKQKTKQKSF